jgi:hypothetical protein
MIADPRLGHTPRRLLQRAALLNTRLWGVHALACVVVEHTNLTAFDNESVAGRANTVWQRFIAGHNRGIAHQVAFNIVEVDARLLRIAENLLPGLHDIGSVAECRPTWVNADHRMFPRPEIVHGLQIFLRKRQVERFVEEQCMFELHASAPRANRRHGQGAYQIGEE